MNSLQSELVEQLKKFRLEKIEPYMEKDDAQARFRIEIFHQLGKLGVTGLGLPEEVGGGGLSYDNVCLALEEIAKSSVPYAVTLSVSEMVQKIIYRRGNSAQRKQWLPPLVAGKEIGAFCLSESSSGSDAAALKTRAEKTVVDGVEGYVINGNKMWVTSGGVAKTYLVFCRTKDNEDGREGISTLLVRDGAAGFSYGKKERKLGWRTSPTRELVFENCFVSADNLLGKEGEGFAIAMEGLNSGRINIGAIAIGLSRRVLDEAINYALVRQQFNRPLFDFQGLQWMMTEMATELEASRLLVERAAQWEEQKRPNRKLASMAKLKATDTAMKIATDAVQILGGVGHTCEYPVERFMRDAKILQIVEGSNQIQRVVIGRELKREYQK